MFAHLQNCQSIKSLVEYHFSRWHHHSSTHYTATLPCPVHTGVQVSRTTCEPIMPCKYIYHISLMLASFIPSLSNTVHISELLHWRIYLSGSSRYEELENIPPFPQQKNDKTCKICSNSCMHGSYSLP